MYNRRILIIDDDPDILNSYQNILAPSQGMKGQSSDHVNRLLAIGEEEKKGFSVDMATQGEEAFNMVRDRLVEDKPYALVFIDVRMPPGWDGIQTAARIRQIDPHIEIVIVTAYSDRTLEEIIKGVGSPEKLILLRKPFDPEEIIQLAFSLIEKWNLTRKEALQRNELHSILRTSPAAIFTINRKK